MKREEIKTLIEGISDEALDAIMDLNGKDISAVRRELNTVNSSNSELEKRIGELEAEKKAAETANMTAEQKLQAQLANATAMQKQFALKSNRLDARTIFSDAGLPSDQVEPLLDSVVFEDAEKTTTTAKAIVDLINAQTEQAVANTKKGLLDKTPTPAGGNSAQGLTKESFNKLGYAEQLKALGENPNLLKELA